MQLQNGGRIGSDGDKEKSPTPYIYFELAQLTRKALGLSAKEKPRKKIRMKLLKS